MPQSCTELATAAAWLPRSKADARSAVISPALAPLAAQLSVLLIGAGLLIFVLAAVAQGIQR